jgi:hypothetical protein
VSSITTFSDEKKRKQEREKRREGKKRCLGTNCVWTTRMHASNTSREREKEIPSIAVYIRSELIMMREATIAVRENAIAFLFHMFVLSLSLSLFPATLVYMLKLIVETTTHAYDG